MTEHTGKMIRQMCRLPTLLSAVACGLLILLAPGQAQDPDNLIRNTTTGLVQGSLVQVQGTNLEVLTFLGIPFAKPPVGPLRFAAPEAPEAWSGVRNGTSHPAMCLQTSNTITAQVQMLLYVTMPLITMSEDCLYLNVYTPTNAREGSKLPVMVWIHGGALVSGMASMYDGSILTASENVVVVTIQYRLGVLGFFSTGDQHAPGNWGYLDQVAALRWVQQNIANFGGNPEQVTIFGESAGATSVSALVISPMAKGLFHRAIMESGVVVLPGLFSNSSETIYTKVASLSACGQVDSEALLRCLRGKSEEEMLVITKTFKIIAAVKDGTFLPRHPLELLASADFQPVPSIIGINNHECGWALARYLEFPGSVNEMDRMTVQATLLNMSAVMKLPSKFSDLVMKEYMGNNENPETLKLQFLEMMGDFLFVIPALQVAHNQSSHGTVYFYEFRHSPSFFKNRPSYVRADHGDEVPFVFGSSFWGIPVNFTVEEKSLNRWMMKYWANFARNGHPNSEDLLYWPPLNQEEWYMQLDIQPSVNRTLKAPRLKFWTETLPRELGAAQENQAGPLWLLPLSLLLFSLSLHIL